MSEAERQAQARRERAARTLRENLQRRKQQGRARRAGDPDEAVGLPAAGEQGEPAESPASADPIDAAIGLDETSTGDIDADSRAGLSKTV